MFLHKTTRAAASVFNIYFKFEVSYLMAPVTRDYWRETIFYTDLYSTYSTNIGFGMDQTEQELDLAHGDIYIYMCIYTCIFNIIKQQSAI